MVKYRKPQTNNVIQQELEVCRTCCTRDFFTYQESQSRDSKRDKILKWFCFVYTLKDNWILGFLEGCQGYQLEWTPADNHCQHQSMIGRAMNLARFDKIQNFGHPRDLSRVVLFQRFEKKRNDEVICLVSFAAVFCVGPILPSLDAQWSCETNSLRVLVPLSVPLHLKLRFSLSFWVRGSLKITTKLPSTKNITGQQSSTTYILNVDTWQNGKQHNGRVQNKNTVRAMIDLGHPAPHYGGSRIDGSTKQNLKRSGNTFAPI